ncbi:MAG: vWA domain-containing protein, partial [Candidatus Bipolaricaulia bacterium]
MKAVQLALTILSPGSGGQIVLASDGRFTDDADEAVALADIAGVPISVLPIGEPIDTDVVLSSITAPREVSLDRPFTVSVAIESSLAATAQLAIYREGSLIGLSNVPLEQGLNRFSFADTVSDPGLYTYQAVARSEDDPVSENDTLLVSVRSTTQPDVLLVEGGDGSAIPDLLDAISLRYVIVESVPDLATLSSYNQLILSEVPLGDLTDGQATSIDRFVRNLGGGMLVVQGEASVRGFTTTKVEHLLPISSITPETEQEASLALVYVLDRSSSMSALVNAKAKIRILRDAVAASAVLLPGRALVGVIGFDTDHDWLIPISPVGDATTVYGMLRKLRAYGGTDLFYPLVDALDALRGVEARSKHILLISDGKTSNEPRDYPGLLSQLEETEDVTLSVIALGDDPRLGLLSSLVESGRGSLYHVSDFSRLPAVTLQVTQRLSRSRFVLEETQVGGPLVRLLADDPPPTIDGYVLTYPRATSQTLLTAGVDPLAATWRVGLGSVTVLNTDL